MRQKTGSYLALGALLFFGGIEIRASEQSEARMTILVHDYAGIDDETLCGAEREADQIFRRAGVAIAWRLCATAANPSGAECPDIGPSTPALRLVSRFRFVAGQVRADTMGYSIGNMMTVSWEEAETVVGSGAGPVSQILGLIIAHEFGHLLGSAHTVSGIMRARWRLADWALARQDGLVFLPRQAAALRKELRTRTETAVAARNTR